MYTLEQIDSLKKAIAGGITEVSYSDKRVRYASISEMFRVLRVMEKSLGLTAGDRRYAEVDKDLA